MNESHLKTISELEDALVPAMAQALDMSLWQARHKTNKKTGEELPEIDQDKTLKANRFHLKYGTDFANLLLKIEALLARSQSNRDNPDDEAIRAQLERIKRLSDEKTKAYQAKLDEFH
jgi:hypothetical protein